MRKEQWIRLLPEDRAVRQYIYSLGDRTDEGYILVDALVKAVRENEREIRKFEDDLRAHAALKANP